MATRPRRALLTVSAFLAVCAVVGAVVGPKVNAQSATDESALRDSLKSFTSVYAIVEQNYAEKMDSDRADKAIYDGAIPGMLHVLDPHSNFYDPKSYAQMREDQHGRYYGVGMTIQPQLIDGTIKIFVLYPFEGTPSFKAGIKPGDQVLSVDSKPTDGLDTAAVASLLKGARGTHVMVNMKREGQAKVLTFDLVRDEIPRPSVDIAFELKPGVGYMHVTNFQETTAREVGDALDNFRAQGPLTGLVIDLRGNPGGLLNQAVDMSDKFLQRGQVVVSQHGRMDSQRDMVYSASHGEAGPKYPVVVLVNRNTASAAEIVSGALQDHDRALIVGETTFGKGLVQTVFPIPENTALALTTFHYYTPSGRLIQRPYDGLSLYDYYYVRADSNPKTNANREVKLTDDGRTVYGGGGITPDFHVDETKFNSFQLGLMNKYAIGTGNTPSFKFADSYFNHHGRIDPNFEVDQSTMAEYRSFLTAQKVPFTEEDLKANAAWLTAFIKVDLVSYQFGKAKGDEARTIWEPEVQSALAELPAAATLLTKNVAKK